MSEVLQAFKGVFGGRGSHSPVVPGDGPGATRRQRATSVQSGAVRAAMLGVNDGLVTNISLILGVVGAAATPEVVRLAGLASLVAGAGSMAAGEYISMRAQVELLDRLLVDEREAIRTDPAREHAVLQDTMQRHGFDEATARAAIRDLSRDPERALTVYSRAVLGMNPEELGSPWTSALSSLATFAAGAMVPMVPWFITTGVSATVGSLALAGAAAVATIRPAAARGHRPGFGHHVPGRLALRYHGVLSGPRVSRLSRAFYQGEHLPVITHVVADAPLLHTTNWAVAGLFRRA